MHIDLTKVKELLNLAESITTKIDKLQDERQALITLARKECSHPAYSRKYWEDDYGKLSDSQYMDTCLICGNTTHSVQL